MKPGIPCKTVVNWATQTIRKMTQRKALE